MKPYDVVDDIFYKIYENSQKWLMPISGKKLKLILTRIFNCGSSVYYKTKIGKS